MSLGRLYGVGYGRTKTAADFRKLIRNHRIDILIDVRFSPRSRFNPTWSKNNTESAVREAGVASYFHDQRLGNPNFRDPGHMKLADPKGLDDLAALLRAGVNVAVMCACSKYATCHRQLIVEGIKKRLPEIEVVHLGEEDTLGI